MGLTVCDEERSVVTIVLVVYEGLHIWYSVFTVDASVDVSCGDMTPLEKESDSF
jgi:hypothetical protein